MKHGSVLDYLRSEGCKLNLKLPQQIDILSQVANGMAYLEEQNCVHRDWSILVGENVLCKVSDFQQVEDDIYEAPEGFKYPVKWTAPEALLYNRFIIKSDVWSCPVWDHLVRPVPLPWYEEVLEALQQGYHMPRPQGSPDKLHKIMMDCWQEDPASRPSFQSLQWELEKFYTTEDDGYQVVDWWLQHIITPSNMTMWQQCHRGLHGFCWSHDIVCILKTLIWTMDNYNNKYVLRGSPWPLIKYTVHVSLHV